MALAGDRLSLRRMSLPGNGKGKGKGNTKMQTIKKTAGSGRVLAGLE